MLTYLNEENYSSDKDYTDFLKLCSSPAIKKEGDPYPILNDILHQYLQFQVHYKKTILSLKILIGAYNEDPLYLSKEKINIEKISSLMTEMYPKTTNIVAFWERFMEAIYYIIICRMEESTYDECKYKITSLCSRGETTSTPALLLEQKFANFSLVRQYSDAPSSFMNRDKKITQIFLDILEFTQQVFYTPMTENTDSIQFIKNNLEEFPFLEKILPDQDFIHEQPFGLPPIISENMSHTKH